MRTTANRLAFWLLLAASPFLFVPAAHAAAIGAFVGLDRLGIWGDFDQNTEPLAHVGPLAGLQAEVGLGSGVALSLQPMYIRQETKTTTASRPSDIEAKLTLDSFSVPVVAKFSLGGGRTYVSSGLDVRFVSSAKVSSGGTEQDAKSNFQDVNLGALVGFGVVFPVGRPQITTEVRYEQGLTNLVKTQIGDLPDRFHSYGWMLAAGILLPLGGH